MSQFAGLTKVEVMMYPPVALTLNPNTEYLTPMPVPDSGGIGGLPATGLVHVGPPTVVPANTCADRVWVASTVAVTAIMARTIERCMMRFLSWTWRVWVGVRRRSTHVFRAPSEQESNQLFAVQIRDTSSALCIEGAAHSVTAPFTLLRARVTRLLRTNIDELGNSGKPFRRVVMRTCVHGHRYRAATRRRTTVPEDR